MDQHSLQNFSVLITNSAMQLFKVLWQLLNNLEEFFFSSCLLRAPVPVRQISEGTAAPSVSDVNVNDRFVDLWKHMICTAQVLKQNEEQGIQKEWYLFSSIVSVSVTDGTLASQTRWLCPRSIG